MKKIISNILSLAAITVTAGVIDPFEQFTSEQKQNVNITVNSNNSINDIGYYYGPIRRQDQNWGTASLIKVHVPGESYVYLSNYVSNWNNIPDLGTVYDMSPGNYGYYDSADLQSLNLEKSEYVNKFISSSGAITEITYYNDLNPSNIIKTKGYLLDYFTEAKDIYLAMTPLDAPELMDSYQFVKDIYSDHEYTDLQSRKYDLVDLAGNIRVNFGIDTEIGSFGREFVAIYTEPSASPISGQPLPGLLIAGIVSLGTITIGKKMRRS